MTTVEDPTDLWVAPPRWDPPHVDDTVSPPAPPGLPAGQAPVAPRPAGAPDARTRAPWERPALAGVLVTTAVLYVWGLGASGWANSFYSAAAQAGSSSWKAWFYGASDAAGSITVDKPPASLWIMGLSVRVFGLSAWSILVPQALMGVATVAVVWATVRRWFSARAALVAAVVTATTPVAALMFRFNNPDAMLTLLMALAAYATVRAIEDGRLRWVILTGALVGLGFLTKQLQALLVVPPLGLAYLVAAPARLRRRLLDLVVAGAAIVAAAGWWIAVVELTPASARPYIGGSQHNSILELTLGYNGFGRLTGDEVGSVVGGGPAGGNGGFWGRTGITRLFDGVSGGQIAWLLPAALVAIVVGLWVAGRRPRTDRTRAAVLVWGGWLVVTALVFSYMKGIYHDYYTIALAPAVGAMVGIGTELLWVRRQHLAARLVMAATVVSTAWWSSQLLDRAPDWTPWLAPAVLVVGFAAAAVLLVGRTAGRAVTVAAGVTAGVVCLAGPTAWALQTVTTPHQGAIVTAGPPVTSGGAGQSRFGPGGVPPGGFAPNGAPNRGGFQPGGFRPGNSPFPGGQGPGGTGGPGGLLDAGTVSDAVKAALLQDADHYTWVAAAVGANRAAGFQLATERSVMPIGGFNGSDPSPTLEQFKQYVSEGKIHWFISGGGFGRNLGGSQESQAIEAWVTSTFTPTTIDGITLYDLGATG